MRLKHPNKEELQTYVIKPIEFNFIGEIHLDHKEWNKVTKDNKTDNIFVITYTNNDQINIIGENKELYLEGKKDTLDIIIEDLYKYTNMKTLMYLGFKTV